MPALPRVRACTGMKELQTCVADGGVDGGRVLFCTALADAEWAAGVRDAPLWRALSRPSCWQPPFAWQTLSMVVIDWWTAAIGGEVEAAHAPPPTLRHNTPTGR